MSYPYDDPREAVQHNPTLSKPGTLARPKIRHSAVLPLPTSVTMILGLLKEVPPESNISATRVQGDRNEGDSYTLTISWES